MLAIILGFGIMLAIKFGTDEDFPWTHSIMTVSGGMLVVGILIYMWYTNKIVSPKLITKKNSSDGHISIQRGSSQYKDWRSSNEEERDSLKKTNVR
jgi:hypothetical protein